MVWIRHACAVLIIMRIAGKRRRVFQYGVISTWHINLFSWCRLLNLSISVRWPCTQHTEMFEKRKWPFATVRMQKKKESRAFIWCLFYQAYGPYGESFHLEAKTIINRKRRKKKKFIPNTSPTSAATNKRGHLNRSPVTTLQPHIAPAPSSRTPFTNWERKR